MTISGIPSTQKTWRVVRRGTPAKALALVTNAPVQTELKDGEVLVNVHAAALNPVGYKLMGLLPNFIARRPHVAEQDLAGVVVESKSHHFVSGQRVFGLLHVPHQLKSHEGSLTEYTRVPEQYLGALPESVSFVDGAGIALTSLTAYTALVKMANIQEGQNVFINGGSTSVGLYAIQIAKAKGAKVWASASGGNEELVRRCGADEFVDYTKGPLHQTLLNSPPATKFHVFVEAVGLADPALYTHSPAYLAPNGVFLSVGPQPGLSLGGIATTFKMAWQYFLHPAWLGGTKRKFGIIQLNPTKADVDAIAGLLSEGKLKPIVDSVFAFEDALKAYDRILSHRAKGKIIVKVNANA